jgi:secreted Zn-dependent insulinase-like peptidase
MQQVYLLPICKVLLIGSKYYSFYRKEDVDKYSFNRHAIIHGANDNYYTKVNAVKLFTFLYLTLELEPVLKIVLNEN